MNEVLSILDEQVDNFDASVRCQDKNGQMQQRFILQLHIVHYQNVHQLLQIFDLVRVKIGQLLVLIHHQDVVLELEQLYQNIGVDLWPILAALIKLILILILTLILILRLLLIVIQFKR